jgi:hypothetical protein
MKQLISFPALDHNESQEALLIISANIVGHRVDRVHVDGGSGAEIMYERRFVWLYDELRNKLEEDPLSLIGFSREVNSSFRQTHPPFHAKRRAEV